MKREALDQDQFKQTSRALIESPAIQEQLSAVMVDSLFSNVDVSAELKGNLPENLQPLAGPLARYLAGVRGHGGAEAPRPSACPGHVRGACLGFAEPRW